MQLCGVVEFNPGNPIYFASGSNDTQVKIWEERMRDPAQILKGHGQVVTALRFSPDGNWLATGAEDGQIIVSAGVGAPARPDSTLSCGT